MEQDNATKPTPFSPEPNALHVFSGDVIVLSAPGPLSEEAVNRLAGTVEAAFPGHTILVLGDGLWLSVLHRAA